MNIKFEWVNVGKGLHICFVGESRWGSARRFAGDAGWEACLYTTCDSGDDIPTLDEAKAWVEEQARAWLAEVTA